MRIIGLVPVAALVGLVALGCGGAPAGDRADPGSAGMGGTGGARAQPDAAAGAGGGDHGGPGGMGGEAGGGMGDEAGGGAAGSPSSRDASDPGHADSDGDKPDAPVEVDGPSGGSPDVTRDTRAGGPRDVAPDRAAPPPVDAAPGGDPEPGRLAGITRFHNDVRAKIPVPPLTWDPTIAATAAAYAAKCQFEHSGASGLGENLAAYAPSGGQKASAPVDDWAGEGADYNYAANSCAAGKVCGHYTQLVWKSSLRLGCAVQSCNVNTPFGAKFPNWDLWVCNYAPPGNYIGERPY